MQPALGRLFSWYGLTGELKSRLIAAQLMRDPYSVSHYASPITDQVEIIITKIDPAVVMAALRNLKSSLNGRHSDWRGSKIPLHFPVCPGRNYSGRLPFTSPKARFDQSFTTKKSTRCGKP